MEKDKPSTEHHETSEGKDIATALHNTTDRHAVLKTILEQRPISPWSKGAFHLYAVCLLVYLCSTMNGYDGSLMGSINAVPSYVKYLRIFQLPVGESGWLTIHQVL